MQQLKCLLFRLIFITTLSLPPMFCGVNALADGQLPVEWNRIDIGSAQPSGQSSSLSDGVFNVTGGGTGLGSASDAFHFVYQSMTGSFVFTAHIKSLAVMPISAIAGLMVREELAGIANYVGIFLTSSNMVEIGVRHEYSTESDIAALPGAQSRPTWLRLAVNGATVRAYTAAGDSSDAGAWTQVGKPETISPELVFAGLCVSSGATGSAATTTFDHVSLSEGVASFDNGVYTIHPVSNENLLLDGSDGSGVPVSIANAAVSSEQVWTVTDRAGGACSLTLAGKPDLALTVVDGSGQPGTKVVLLPYRGLDTQQWLIVPDESSSYNVYSKHDPDTGLDDYGGSAVPGKSIDIWSNIAGDPHQEWTFVPKAH